ncbi:MAG: CvpA family protein [Patescibacteria group bacterium]|jgi:uncharacterized membrane protein required for colicin V production
MNIIDWVIIIFFALFVFSGFREGLIMAVGGLLGFFVAIFLATHYYAQAGNALAWMIQNENAQDIVGFVLILIVVSKGFGIILWAINKVFNIIAIVPGLKLLNRIGGAGFGAIQAVLILGIASNFAGYLPLTPDGVNALENSWAADWLGAASSWLTPLFPEAIEKLKDAVL